MRVEKALHAVGCMCFALGLTNDDTNLRFFSPFPFCARYIFFLFFPGAAPTRPSEVKPLCVLTLLPQNKTSAPSTFRLQRAKATRTDAPAPHCLPSIYPATGVVGWPFPANSNARARARRHRCPSTKSSRFIPANGCRSIRYGGLTGS